MSLATFSKLRHLDGPGLSSNYIIEVAIPLSVVAFMAMGLVLDYLTIAVYPLVGNPLFIQASHSTGKKASYVKSIAN